MFLIFDTETTGLPKNHKAPVSDSDNWPRLVQLAWQLHDETGKLINNKNYIVKPDGYTIPFNSEKIHGISTERALRDGYDLSFVLDEFNKDLKRSKYNVGHNIEFDINIVGAELYRMQMESPLAELKKIDTKDVGTDFCAIPGGKGGKYKWPSLTELHQKLFGKGFDDAHDAAYDVDATARCFFGLITQNVFKPEEITNASTVVYEAPELEAANFETATEFDMPQDASEINKDLSIDKLKDAPFTHLHVHSQFSVLQATSDVKSIISTAKSMNMDTIALTDHGNMMAAFHFVKEALANDIKPIVGCEFNVCDNHTDKSRKNDGFQSVLLAKNKNGYQNLAKMASIAYVEGFYYVPRIDKDVLVKYKDDIIATTGGLWGEIPFLILNVGEEQAEEAFLWWKEQFGEDFYVELNRHGIEEEEVINKVLLRFAEKHKVKYFAANNTYYSKREDSKAHDILLCVKDGETVNKPKKYIGKRGREFRYGFPNDEFYLKTPDEMKQLFADLPEAIFTIKEITDKCEGYELARSVLLPEFDIPAEFQDPKDKEDPGLKNGENNYLRHLTYEGAKKRYAEITDEIRERLDFELEVIRKTGYPGYFLIVQDFTTAAREMGVSVGPGRGSAAGSAVAYCIGITNVDPIKYDLLFERFLNPDRVSMPDIDIDFDDEGRQKVIDYVIEKYGANQVAQIITYGTMAAKSSIRDTARALALPLNEADRVAKLVPDIKLNKLFGLDDKALNDKLKNNSDQINMAKELKTLANGADLVAQTINQAKILEGSVRNTGIHACGVIITPDDITNFVPVALAKDSDMYCTQYDNSVAEEAGLLKMDFLGLKTLTLIKDAVNNVKERHGIDLDPEEFPMDDTKTYELFQRGETVGIFQYESPGMQKYLRDLKPTEFSDLIAMNALYRPGPLEYIPSFVRRKHGIEKITYDLDAMEEYLEETYGITVYQEQVMLLSQKLAGFTKGEADTLRKAMGKKKLDLLAKLKPKFLDQGEERGHKREILEKVWKDWEAFASYAFNKSHSTCYAWVAYQTAYLKAHYPAEYMASVLSNNMNNISDVKFFMEECQRMGIQVLGPDVNESFVDFTVNKEGNIRFGMAAIKGVGEAAVNSIIEEREKGGSFKDIYSFVERVNLHTVNKKNIEGLALSGAFDNFPDIERHQFFIEDENNSSFIDTIIRYGNKFKEDKAGAQNSLFGAMNGGVEISKPAIPSGPAWTEMMKLNREKELVGIYLSAHPLDRYRFEFDNLRFTPLSALGNLAELEGKEIMVGGLVTEAVERTTKTGKPFGMLTLEDFNGSNRFMFFSKQYLESKKYFTNGYSLMIKGRVQKREWPKDSTELEFKAISIHMLSDVREDFIKSLQFNVALETLTEEWYGKIKEQVEQNPGKVLIKFKVIDQEDKIALNMQSRSFQVEINENFLDFLNKNPEFEYKVN